MSSWLFPFRQWKLAGDFAVLILSCVTGSIKVQGEINAVVREAEKREIHYLGNYCKVIFVPL